MSILSALDSLILRITANPPLVTKGAELTYAEMDTRIIGFYDAVQSIVSGVNVTAYDAGHTYDQYDTDIRNRYASYGSRIWQAAYAGSPSSFSGQTPAEGVYWTQVTLAEMLPNILELARLSERLTADNDPAQIYRATIEATSAEILNGNSLPQQFGLTVPAGYYVLPISITFKSEYGSAAYATSINFRVRAVGSSTYIASYNINYTTDQFAPMSVSGTSGEQYVSGADLEWYIATTDPTAGDSDITLYLTYALIEI